LRTHPNRQQDPKTYSTHHNFLFQHLFLVLTPSPFYLTHDPNTYRFMCNISMSFPRHMSAKMPISSQNHKKGDQWGGELLPSAKNTAHPNLPHIPITPSLTPSSDILSFPPRNLVLTHHGSKNTAPPIPSKRDRHKTRTRGRKFFSLPKRVKPQICLDLLVRRRKR
jgi:hypothetical protein